MYNPIRLLAPGVLPNVLILVFCSEGAAPHA